MTHLVFHFDDRVQFSWCLAVLAIFLPLHFAQAAVTRFRDCPECPLMTVVPAGHFEMGSPEMEPGRYDDEGPRHEVAIARPFAIGWAPVTFAEWDACVADGACNGYSPPDHGWGRGERPVIDVSWLDAQAYLAWLNARTATGAYRLPSEAEWEYAARAGTVTPWWCGAEQACTEGAMASAADAGRRTLPVGSKMANSFGLVDMGGNVWQWVADCYVSSYDGARADGEAAVGTPGCSRVGRGGSWANGPGFLRSANRGRNLAGDRDFVLGFRVAKTLGP